MKVYKFIFIIGLFNVLLPFIGIPSLYKQYVYVATGVFALLYALILRTVQKEKEAGLVKSASVVRNQEYRAPQPEVHPTRKIEEVVEMEESQAHKNSRIKTKRPTIKAKVTIED